MPFVFSHVEYCDMHCVCGFCDGNARAAVDEYPYTVHVCPAVYSRLKRVHAATTHVKCLEPYYDISGSVYVV